MKLSRLFFWNSAQSVPSTIENSLVAPESSVNATRLDGSSTGALFYLSSPVINNGVARNTELDKDATNTVATPIQSKGLMGEPELVSFLSENYFGLGVHNGAHFKTQESLQLGREALISRFQNALTSLLWRKQERINWLQSELIAVEGISPSISNQLKLACEHLEREAVELRRQIDVAGEGKGWVLEPLNRYQIGYIKGLREAIDFELLAR